MNYIEAEKKGTLVAIELKTKDNIRMVYRKLYERIKI